MELQKKCTHIEQKQLVHEKIKKVLKLVEKKIPKFALAKYLI